MSIHNLRRKWHEPKHFIKEYNSATVVESSLFNLLPFIVSKTSEDTTHWSPAQDRLLSAYSQSFLLSTFLGVFIVNVSRPLLVLGDKYM